MTTAYQIDVTYKTGQVVVVRLPNLGVEAAMQTRQTYLDRPDVRKVEVRRIDYPTRGRVRVRKIAS